MPPTPPLSPADYRALLALAATRLEQAPAEQEPPLVTNWALPPLTRALLEVLIAAAGVSHVLEFGAGRSSVVIARALAARGGGRLTSVDHEPAYAQEPWATVAACSTVDAELVVAGLGWTECQSSASFRSYTGIDEALARRGPFDMVLIDGPPGARIGRTATLYQAAPHLSPGALVLLDDYARPAEHAAVERWLRDIPTLESLVLDRTFARGIALLRMGAQPDAHQSCPHST